MAEDDLTHIDEIALPIDAASAGEVARGYCRDTTARGLAKQLGLDTTAADAIATAYAAAWPPEWRKSVEQGCRRGLAERRRAR